MAARRQREREREEEGARIPISPSGEVSSDPISSEQASFLNGSTTS
jgi:hypothetical protein